MSNLRIWGVAVGVILVFVVQRHMFVSMPAMTRAADVVVVGKEGGDHARYSIGDQVEISALSLGYDMPSIGNAPLSELGTRAVLSYIAPQLFAAAQAQAKCTGSCMAGPLNAYESQGRIGHLLLVPGDDGALSSMKHAKIDSGDKFRLSGHWLTLDAGEIAGNGVNFNLGNTHFFLVDSIAAAN